MEINQVEQAGCSSSTKEEINNKSLLSCVQNLVELEMELTNCLSDTKELLDLPTPKNMSQVNTILAIARTYSTRTSAPPGWNPNLPVIHFSTPNPLPHQLRQGALGAMELKLVREERAAKRRKIEQDQLNKRALEESKKRNSETVQRDQSKDAKKKEVMEHYKEEDDEANRRLVEKRQQALKRRREHKPAKNTSMNLSDSEDSSSEEDSD